jgi:hypothetical protein
MTPTNFKWVERYSELRETENMTDSIIKLVEEVAALNRQGWTRVDNPPEVGGEYNVVWDLSDGEEPVVSTMEWDAIKKKWIDTRSWEGQICETVLYWMPLPNKP